MSDLWTKIRSFLTETPRTDGPSGEAKPAIPRDGEPQTDLVTCGRHYWRSAGRYERAHWSASGKCLRWHRGLGAVSVALSAAVATSAFAALSESTDTNLRLLTGALAVLAAIAASLVTFLGYQERAKLHLTAGGRFAKLRRTLDLYVIELSGSNAVTREEALASLKVAIEELSNAVQASPGLSGTEYLVGKQAFDDHYPLTTPAGPVAMCAGSVQRQQN